jgi:hypothetical protein
MAESGDHGMHIALDRANLDKAGLYLVTLTRKREGFYPAVTSCYVIAPDEKEAIEQCQALAFPESNESILGNPDNKALLTASAVRIPVMIRGWGHQTF